MIFKAPKEKLEKNISIANSIIGSNPQINILTNFVLETEDDKINVTSTNLEVTIKSSFNAIIEVEGSITVNAAKFLQIVKYMPSDDVYFEVNDNLEIKIKSENKKDKAIYTLKGIARENYPAVPDESLEGQSFNITQADLKDMIQKTIFSISTDDARPYLNGIYIERDENNLKFVTTDGRRLSYIERQMELADTVDIKRIVPQRVLNEMVKYLSDEGIVKVTYSKNQIFFFFNNISFISKLIDGTFPDYNQVIPKVQEKFAYINRLDFLNALNHSKTYIDKNKNKIILDFSDNRVIMSMSNMDIGSFREELIIKYENDPIEIAFNHTYLEAFFKQNSSEDIIIEMNTALSPVSLKNKDIEGYVYIVMPMKVTG